MNPNNESQRGRLFKSIEHSYRSLESFRNLNRALVTEYAGSGYGSSGTRPRYEIIVNLMNQAIDAYMLSTAGNRPRVMVSSVRPALKTFSKHFQTALNNLISEIQLERILRQWVLDAFFCVGLVKVHLADSVEVEVEAGKWMDPGSPFVSNVSLDNWVHDVSANRVDKVSYMADMFRIPFEDMKSDIFDQKVVKRLSPNSKYAANDDQDRLERMERGDEVDPDEFEPHIDLMDVWVPRDSKIYTFAVDNVRKFSGVHEPVAVLDWDGPEFGPYHVLGFADVPENIMPASPASHLAALMRNINSLFRKQLRKARGQKDVFTYTPTGADSAKKVQRSDDQDWVEVQDQSELSMMKIGGADQGNQALLINLIEIFDRAAGNLTAMLGLGAQAETASQEKLIHGANSQKEISIQKRVADGTTSVIRDLGHLLWNDVVKVVPGNIPIQGTPYSIDATWTPEDREGKFLDYDIAIDVYSMRYQSPAEKADILTDRKSVV